jgi:hypothetical protein
LENDASIRVWKAFGVGNGKKIAPTCIYVNHQEGAQLHVKTMFPERSTVKIMTMLLRMEVTTYMTARNKVETVFFPHLTSWKTSVS